MTETKQVHRLTGLVVREADEKLQQVVLVGGPRDGETWEISASAVVIYPPIINAKLSTQVLRYQKDKEGKWTFRESAGEPVPAEFSKSTVRVRK